jgi:hypothetical protein
MKHWNLSLLRHLPRKIEKIEEIIDGRKWNKVLQPDRSLVNMPAHQIPFLPELLPGMPFAICRELNRLI